MARECRDKIRYAIFSHTPRAESVMLSQRPKRSAPTTLALAPRNNVGGRRSIRRTKGREIPYSFKKTRNEYSVDVGGSEIKI